jgi:hypothetical protein
VRDIGSSNIIGLFSTSRRQLVNLLITGAETAEEGAEEAWVLEIARRVESIDNWQAQFISAEFI